MPPQNKVPFSKSHPELLSWWSSSNVLRPSQVTSGSKKKVLWVCQLGHEWEGSVHHFAMRGQRCPYCSGHRVFIGFNDLVTTQPELSAEWHPIKNETLTAKDVSAGSNKKVWWLGKDCGHEWISSIINRVRHGHGCAVCRGYQTQIGSNDLATTHPNLVNEWHPTKNTVSFHKVTAGSGREIWWLGKDCGHEWSTTVAHRVSGRNCPYCAGVKVLKGFNDLATTHPELSMQWSAKNSKKPEEVSLGSTYIALWLCPKNHEWSAAVYSRTGGKGCPICSAEKTYSLAEKQIADYIISLGVEILTNRRSVIKGELDIYIPEKNIAIEFNGVYWHSEAAGKNKFYHYDKWKTCKEKGIQLIQIWEDEYTRNPELVKSMLAHKLGVTNQRKVFARKTEVIQLAAGESNLFLEQNHIQGAVDGGIRLGLIEKSVPGIVLAVMVLKREPGTSGKTLNLLRFATSANVVGGFTKLLKHVEKEHAPESIITFSDNCVSDGGLYLNNGFTAIKELPPDYKYVVKGERVHKFQYRLKRFREDPNLLFEEDRSERQLAQLNNLPRIWDAGKIKWERKIVV